MLANISLPLSVGISGRNVAYPEKCNRPVEGIVFVSRHIAEAITEHPLPGHPMAVLSRPQRLLRETSRCPVPLQHLRPLASATKSRTTQMLKTFRRHSGPDAR